MDPAPLASLDSSFAAALENMKPGQISEVVESQFGFHIIQMLDKRGSLYHFRHILLRPVYTIDELTEGTHFLDSIANLIRKDSITFEKAALLYDEIDRNPLFRGTVEKEDRSLMNICFVMAEGCEELAPEFMEFAKSRGMVGIKGHRLVGGFRASCYNALPKESVEALVACMQEFAEAHKK